MTNSITVAVQQHFLSHYREGVYTLMSSQAKSAPSYDFYSDICSLEDIATINIEALSQHGGKNNIRWHYIHNWWLFKVVLFQPGIITVALSKQYQCIIFLGSIYHITTWIAAVLAKITGKRVLMWTHGYLKEEPGLKGCIREIFYRIADGLLLYGNRARVILENKGFNSKNLYVVYNSLNYSEQKSIRSKWNDERLLNLRHKYFEKAELPIIIFVGRTTKRKRLDLILHAQMELQRIGKLVNVIIVGNGPDKASLIRIVEKNQLSKYVEFIDACYDETVLGPFFMMSDICVSPGEVGLTCIHSFAYGTPVITHDDFNHQGPECEAIIPGETGDFFKKDDQFSLAQIILKWLDSERSRDVIAKKCISVVENYYSPENQLRVINRAVEGLPAENHEIWV
jgi:glycosyltransferase involved in cell wall biosynthesis